jgi:hypothetical protein
VQRWLDGTASASEAQVVEALIETWRGRLFDLSWFMKCLNEYLARRANAEDECDGKFWQARFRSQALLDEAGLLTAMAYVDLNPVRAGVAATPEDSEFTSIYDRIRAIRPIAARRHTTPGVPLQPFRSLRETRPQIPFSLKEYLALVDWSGRLIRSDKPGAIDRRQPPIIKRLGINEGAWDRAMRPHGNVFGRALGKLDRLRLHARTLGQAWVRGLRQAERLYA